MDPPKVEDDHFLPNILRSLTSDRDDEGRKTSPKEADDAVKGLAGLVVLGNAWESVDIFHALRLALRARLAGLPRGDDGGRTSLAYLAWLRRRELIDAGKGSMLPDAPRGEELKESIREPNYIPPKEALDSAFVKLRAEAEAWHTARTAFMMRRLEQGLHPDTDRGFWTGYAENPPPVCRRSMARALPVLGQPCGAVMIACLVLGIPILAVGLAAGWVVRRARARWRKAGPVESLSSDFFRGIPLR